MTDGIEIRLLGPFEVRIGGRPASVSGPKRHALLALLALRRGRIVGVDTLIEALWGADLPVLPRNALQQHVARLRAALGHDSIAAFPDGYALENATVDALIFEDLLGAAHSALRGGDPRTVADSVTGALALWRGAPLQGLPETTFLSAEARRLEALRLDGLEEQFDASLALGEHREILPAIRHAIEENPFRERLWGQLMLGLYRSGRQADALATFQEARHVLMDELGLEPGSELRRLQDAILAHDSAIVAVPIVDQRHESLPAPMSSVERADAPVQLLELLRDHLRHAEEFYERALAAVESGSTFSAPAALELHRRAG